MKRVLTGAALGAVVLVATVASAWVNTVTSISARDAAQTPCQLLG